MRGSTSSHELDQIRHLSAPHARGSRRSTPAAGDNENSAQPDAHGDRPLHPPPPPPPRTHAGINRVTGTCNASCTADGNRHPRDWDRPAPTPEHPPQGERGSTRAARSSRDLDDTPRDGGVDPGDQPARLHGPPTETEVSRRVAGGSPRTHRTVITPPTRGSARSEHRPAHADTAYIYEGLRAAGAGTGGGANPSSREHRNRTAGQQATSDSSR